MALTFWSTEQGAEGGKWIWRDKQKTLTQKELPSAAMSW